MAALPDLNPCPEAHRARAKFSDLPRCDGLRICALAMAATQFLRMSRFSEVVDLAPVVQAEFTLTGFLFAGFLLRDRGQGLPRTSAGLVGGLATKAASILKSLPTASILAVVGVLLYLPGLLAVEKVPVPELAEVPALIDRALRVGLADFLGNSVDGRTLIAWPLIVLFLPRRLLGVTFLAALASGLAVQFSGLLSGELRPASIIVPPSPLDLMAAGALVAAAWQGVTRSGNGALARWAMLMGLALAAASIGFRSRDPLSNWGSLALLSAPPGFGAINFILKIMATTMVGSLAWRDLGR